MLYGRYIKLANGKWGLCETDEPQHTILAAGHGYLNEGDIKEMGIEIQQIQTAAEMSDLDYILMRHEGTITE